MAIVSSNGTLTVLSITPPSYSCAACSFSGGVAVTLHPKPQTLDPNP